MHLKMSSAKRRPFCLGLNVLTHICVTRPQWVKLWTATLLDIHGGTTEEGNCSYLLPLSHRDIGNGLEDFAIVLHNAQYIPIEFRVKFIRMLTMTITMIVILTIKTTAITIRPYDSCKYKASAISIKNGIHYLPMLIHGYLIVSHCQWGEPCRIWVPSNL